MRIEQLINDKVRSIEPERDFSFLNDEELERLEQLLQKDSLSDSEYNEAEKILDKTIGNVITSWHNQADITGNESLRDLFNDYKAYCENNEYSTEAILTFRDTLEELGININSNLQ